MISKSNRSSSASITSEHKRFNLVSIEKDVLSNLRERSPCAALEL